MSKQNIVLGVIAGCGLSSMVLAETSLQEAIKGGTVNGNLRSHYNMWDYGTATDQNAFALGGALRAETGAIGWAKFGLGYYTAQDLDTNDSNPAKVDGRMGSD